VRGGSGIWRALQRARDLNLADAGERPSLRGAEGISRRRVIAALAGGGAALAMPRLAAAQPSGPRVAIVVGGLAGLVALKRLRAAGVDATLRCAPTGPTSR